MVNGFFTTISEHEDKISSNDIIVSNTNFIKCSAPQGGGFFSESNVHHVVKYCYFSLCAATDSVEGRGGAFLIKKIKYGGANIMFCCAEQCTSQFGSDIMAWDLANQHITHITSIRSINGRHPLFITCMGNVLVNNINSTQCSTNSQARGYGNGINLYISDTPHNMMFFNLIENSGEVSVLELEGAHDKSVEISHVNIINNKNGESYISFFRGSDSTIKLTNSIIVGNQGNPWVGDKKIIPGIPIFQKIIHTKNTCSYEPERVWYNISFVFK